MSAKAPDFPPGTLLPGTKYRVVKQIGAGGMGVVYQVVKPPEIMGVLKLMSSDLTEHEEFRTRFLDEVRVLAQIDHPNIVKVFDYDALPDGTPFYVMELLHGRTVRDVLGTMGTLPPRVAFEVTRQLCEALHCAHTHRIPVIHRDIKPENIFLHAPRHGEPVVKLIDFGVVAVADRQHDNAFVGTWKYAAPEQIRGERATPATDLYAVGLVLYEMLCGIGPFEHLDSGTLVSQAHLREIPAPVSKFAPWVPPSIVQLIASSLAKEPKHRPRDAYAFAERLFELEWANDGKDPNDRTSEGPLSRILSTAGGKPSSKHLVAAPPKDRLGNVPLVGIPEEARHGGPTRPGVGGNTHEPTSPGEDALLAGLGAMPAQPRSKKARDSDPAMAGMGALGEVAAVAAPAPATIITDDSSVGTTRVKAPRGATAQTIDSDTLGAQESDAQFAPRHARTWRLALPIALAVVALIGVGSFAAYRARTPAAPAALTGNTETPPSSVALPPPMATTPTAIVAEGTPIAPASAVSAVVAYPPGSTPPKHGRPPVGPAKTGAAAGVVAPVHVTPVIPVASVAPPTPASAAPTPTKPPDNSFVRGL